VAREAGIRFFGPNCIGILNTHARFDDSGEICHLNCTAINYHGKRPGNVSMISQSGTWASHIFMVSEDRVVDLSKSFSVGNEADIDMCDCLEFLGFHDESTDVILMYIEEIKRGRRFMELARAITPHKPIIALYVGGSEAGAKAVASHTGSMAGNDRIYDAVFKQCGVVRVYTVEEMMDAASLFSKALPLGALPRGRRLAIMTAAGGPGATMADRASRLGITLPQLSSGLADRVSKYLTAVARPGNPLDFTFNLNSDTFYIRVPKLLLASGEFDALIAYGAFGPKFFTFSGNVGIQFLETPENRAAVKAYMDVLKGAIDSSIRLVRRHKVPIIFINLLGYRDEIYVYLNEKGYPTFSMPHQAVNALNKLMEYGEYRTRLERRDEQQYVVNERIREESPVVQESA
jgi:acyl-CoA synthetase (NDP forming)